MTAAPELEASPHEAKPAALAASPSGKRSGNYVLGPADGGDAVEYEKLRRQSHCGRENIDPMKREQYLSDAEFQKVLGAPRAKFQKMQPWQQERLKKAGLF